jgi:hypothetical protein
MTKASRQGLHPLWLSAGYGVQALGQVTAQRIHLALQEGEVITKASHRGCHYDCVGRMIPNTK